MSQASAGAPSPEAAVQTRTKQRFRGALVSMSPATARPVVLERERQAPCWLRFQTHGRDVERRRKRKRCPLSAVSAILRRFSGQRRCGRAEDRARFARRALRSSTEHRCSARAATRRRDGLAASNSRLRFSSCIHQMTPVGTVALLSVGCAAASDAECDREHHNAYVDGR